MANKIAVIGSTGLVGGRVTKLLKKKFEIEELNSSSGFDITNKDSVARLEKSDAEVVIHLAAKASVDGCEEDKSLGERGDAWRINVDGVRNVAEICSKTSKKLMYVSTDFVFDGKKPVGEKYEEIDAPSPVNWYGQTKYEGEKIVRQLETPWIIARIAYPYRASHEKKKDFARIIRDLIEEGRVLSAVTDHIMCPTYVDDIARAFEVLIDKSATGTFHVVGSEALSPFDAVEQIANVFGLDDSQVEAATREEYFGGKAPRPYNLSLKNDKITSLGAEMRGFEEGLQAVKRQLENQKY